MAIIFDYDCREVTDAASCRHFSRRTFGLSGLVSRLRRRFQFRRYIRASRYRRRDSLDTSSVSASRRRRRHAAANIMYTSSPRPDALPLAPNSPTRRAGPIIIRLRRRASIAVIRPRDFDWRASCRFGQYDYHVDYHSARSRANCRAAARAAPAPDYKREGRISRLTAAFRCSAAAIISVGIAAGIAELSPFLVFAGHGSIHHAGLDVLLASACRRSRASDRGGQAKYDDTGRLGRDCLAAAPTSICPCLPE